MSKKTHKQYPRLSIRLSDTERLVIESRAQRAGLSMGGYCKFVIFNTDPPRRSRRVVPEKAELSDEQRVKRHLLIKSGRDKFRRGVRGIFDRVSGRHKRLTLINRKKGALLKARQIESREKLIFRQNRERSELQKSIVALRHQQRQERTLLAKRVNEFRQSEVQRVRRSTDFDQWTKARNISKDFEKVSSEKGRSTDAPKKPSRDKPTRQRTRRRDLE